MTKSKNRKNHKQKVASRNQRIQSEKNKMKKFQDAFYQQMMEDIKNGSLDDDNVKPLDSKDDEEAKPTEVEIVDTPSKSDIIVE